MALPKKSYYSLREAAYFVLERAGQQPSERDLLTYAVDGLIEVGAHFARATIWLDDSSNATHKVQNTYLSLPIDHLQVEDLMEAKLPVKIKRCMYEGKSVCFQGARKFTGNDWQDGLWRGDLVIPYSSLDLCFPAAPLGVPPPETMALAVPTKKNNEKPLSAERARVLVALLAKADINMHEKRGQAAKLCRFVNASDYGPVSDDLCSDMVNEIKEQMKHWD